MHTVRPDMCEVSWGDRDAAALLLCRRFTSQAGNCGPGLPYRPITPPWMPLKVSCKAVSSTMQASGMFGATSMHNWRTVFSSGCFCATAAAGDCFPCTM